MDILLPSVEEIGGACSNTTGRMVEVSFVQLLPTLFILNQTLRGRFIPIGDKLGSAILVIRISKFFHKTFHLQ